MTRKNLKLTVSLIMIIMFAIAIIDSEARAGNAPGVTYRTVTIDLDTGHFALETHGQEIADLMRDFLNRKVASPPLAAN